jgi:hypothetical protein
VGSCLRSGHAACRTATKGRVRSTPRPVSNATCSLCRDEHGSLCAEYRRPGLPHAASSRRPHAAQAADRHDAEVAAAPQGCRLQLEELANGEFKRVIGEVDELDAKKVKRVVLCSGKVYYDLLAARREKKITDIAIVRIEQLYPFPKESLQNELAKYPKATEIVWCQEEPRNQGAWYWIASRQHLENEIGLKQKLLLVSRPASSSPAVGYLAKHNEQQKALIESALGKIEY